MFPLGSSTLNKIGSEATLAGNRRSGQSRCRGQGFVARRATAVRNPAVIHSGGLGGVSRSGGHAGGSGWSRDPAIMRSGGRAEFRDPAAMPGGRGGVEIRRSCARGVAAESKSGGQALGVSRRSQIRRPGLGVSRRSQIRRPGPRGVAAESDPAARPSGCRSGVRSGGQGRGGVAAGPIRLPPPP
jgi:hypothetical protein